jgi:hypothetical protein
MPISEDGGTTVYIRQNTSTGGIQQSIDQSTWIDVSLPYNVTNTNTSVGVLTIIFDDITLTGGTNRYFTCSSNYITFGSDTLRNDGSRPVIEISGVTNYPGLIRNTSYSYITIQNIVVDGTMSTLVGNAGWVAQSEFSSGATDNLIRNCSSMGNISNGSGGIAGYNIGLTSSSPIQIIGCSSTGDIQQYGGGIVGGRCRNSTIERCYSTGSIGNDAGGIAGVEFGTSPNTICNIVNCYSTGTTIDGGGGIVGLNAGYNNTSSSVNITNCYSTGNIINNGGGIVARDAYPKVNVQNCYTTGPISDGAGGIYGANAATAATANNCYTSGISSGTGGGIFAGSSDDNRSDSSNNYSEENQGGSGGWITSHAISALIDYPTITDYGSVWSRPDGVDQPYKLSNSGYSPYSLSLVDTVTYNIAVGGGSTPAPLVPGYTFIILQINDSPKSAYPFIDINNSTGVITADSNTPVGDYVIIVYSSKNPYSVTEYTLHVTSGPTPTPTIEILSCCDRPLYLKGADNTTRAQIKSGNVLIGATTKAPYPSYSDWVYRKMALASKR